MPHLRQIVPLEELGSDRMRRYLNVAKPQRETLRDKRDSGKKGEGFFDKFARFSDWMDRVSGDPRQPLRPSTLSPSDERKLRNREIGINRADMKIWHRDAVKLPVSPAVSNFLGRAGAAVSKVGRESMPFLKKVVDTADPDYTLPGHLPPPPPPPKPARAGNFQRRARELDSARKRGEVVTNVRRAAPIAPDNSAELKKLAADIAAIKDNTAPHVKFKIGLGKLWMR